jgi:hypothetical protein
VGDAYFYRGEIGAERYVCPPGLLAYQKLMEVDRAARLANQQRIRDLSLTQSEALRIFCAHDAREFELLSGAQVAPDTIAHVQQLQPA